MDTKQALIYWITEREKVRERKEAGLPKPWSDDPVFQNTYFCNVHREDDKTTRFIRQKYAAYGTHPFLIYNYILARLINRIESLQYIPFQDNHRREELTECLEDIATLNGQLWSGAYIITTHGLPMGKVAYLVNHVLQGTSQALGRNIFSHPVQGWQPHCATYHEALMGLEGLGSFLAAQVVADLKNTYAHPLQLAPDRDTFVAHGPGSLRGASWFHFGEIGKVTPNNFHTLFRDIEEYVRENTNIWVDSQDLQNCLCEFDKYMRVRTGVGKSKRKYNGISNS